MSRLSLRSVEFSNNEPVGGPVADRDAPQPSPKERRRVMGTAAVSSKHIDRVIDRQHPLTAAP